MRLLKALWGLVEIVVGAGIALLALPWAIIIDFAILIALYDKHDLKSGAVGTVLGFSKNIIKHGVGLIMTPTAPAKLQAAAPAPAPAAKPAEQKPVVAPAKQVVVEKTVPEKPSLAPIAAAPELVKPLPVADNKTTVQPKPVIENKAVETHIPSAPLSSVPEQKPATAIPQPFQFQFVPSPVQQKQPGVPPVSGNAAPGSKPVQGDENGLGRG